MLKVVKRLLGGCLLWISFAGIVFSTDELSCKTSEKVSNHQQQNFSTLIYSYHLQAALAAFFLLPLKHPFFSAYKLLETSKEVWLPLCAFVLS